MTTQRRKTRKALKQADNFITTSARAIDYLEENQKTVVWTLVAIISVCLIIAGVIYIRKSLIKRGEGDLFAAYQQSLESKEAGNTQENKKVIESYKKIMEGYSVKDIRVKGQLELGNLYFQNEEYELAKSSFETAADSVSPDTTFGGVANLGLAKSLIQLGQDDRALEILLKMEGEEYLVSKAEVYYYLAHAYKNKGDSVKSMEYLKKISEFFPEFLPSVSLSKDSLEVFFGE